MRSLSPSLGRLGPWALLAGLLVVLAVIASLHDRSGWRGLVAGEATVLMQSESLLLDRDLAYTRLDYDRFTARWGGAPTDLDLVSGSDGRRITFDRPPIHALVLAPFLAVSPRNGFALLNVVLLGFTALLAARVASRTVPAAPIVIAVLVFASVTFAHVFFATSTVFCLALTVAALALVVDRPPGVGRLWLAAGGILAVVIVVDPLYAALPAVLLIAAGRDRWPLLTGVLLGWGLLALVRAMAGGGLVHGFDAVAFRFSPATGFPLVDFAADAWSSSVRELRAFHRGPPFAWGLDVGLAVANLKALTVGRSIGLLPYFLPLAVLPLFAGRDRIRRCLPYAALLFALSTLVLRPFDLASAGGPGTLANGAFLPLYGALWLLPSKPRHGGMALVAAVLAAPFLLPLWRSPGQEPFAAGTPSYPSALARERLPLEISQRWLADQPFLEHRSLWVRPLTDTLWVEEQKTRLVIAGPAWAELVIASILPLDVLRLEFGADAPSQIEVEGAELGERLLEPGGGIAFRVVVERIAHHPLWWTPRRMNLYRLTMRLPAATEGVPLAFRMLGERRADDATEE